MEQLQEVFALLTVIKELAGHPTQFTYIRAAAVNRLSEINDGLNPNPSTEVEVDETPADAEDNPATTREAVEEEEPADG